MDINIIWNSFLEKIKEQVSSLSYDTWFKDTRLASLEDNNAVVVVPMILHKKHLVENYLEIMEDVFNSITGTNFNFVFITEDEDASNRNGNNANADLIKEL